MPKDEWKKSRDRQRFGPVGCAKKERKATRRAARHLSANQILGRFNVHSRIGFGKYADREIQDTPVDYLRWLIGNINPRSARMVALVAFLREYLAPVRLCDGTYQI